MPLRRRLTGTSVAVALAVVTVCGATSPAAAEAKKTAAPSPVVVAALGDSITQGYASNGLPWNHPSTSWSTGSDTRVDSHARRLTQAGYQVTSVNAAVSGSASADLASQARSAARQRAAYVTVLVGANDICGSKSTAAMPSPSAYEANVRQALDALGPKSTVMLVSIPSLKGLYGTGKGVATVRLRWKVAGICPVMLADPLSTSKDAKSRRATVEKRVRAYNARLSDLADERDNVFYDNGAVYSTHVTLSDLSVLDRFHPSVRGQDRIADTTWEQVMSQHALDRVNLTPVA